MEKWRLEHVIEAWKKEREDSLRLEISEREDMLLRKNIRTWKIKVKMKYERRKNKEKWREKIDQQERIEIEKEKLHFELKMKELEVQGKSKPKPMPLDSSKTFDITKHIRLVPPF